MIVSRLETLNARPTNLRDFRNTDLKVTGRGSQLYASPPGSGDKEIDVSSLMQKYNTGGVPVSGRGATPPSQKATASPSAAAAPHGFDVPAGVAVLVLLNCAIFAAATVFQSPAAASLTINPNNVQWWSFVTSAFVNHNVEQLGRNMFVVFFFSQMVYRDLGAVGVWFAYLLAGIGANLSSWAFLAGTAKVKALSMLGVASSGGALGVFLAAMALSFRPSITWVMGAVLSGNFVLSILLKAPASAAAALTASSASSQPNLSSLLMGGDPVALVGALIKSLKTTAVSPGNSWAIGAAAAAAVVVILARIPDEQSS